MAKKGLLVFVLVLVVSVAAFAQFFAGAGVYTNFSTGAWPSIEIGSSVPNLDLLLGFDLYIAAHSVDFFDNPRANYSLSINEFGFYAGVAPKVTLTGNWSLSFPLLARLYFGAQKYHYDDDNRTTSNINYLEGYPYPGRNHFGFGFRAGGRASYGFSEHWSLYTGFLITVIERKKDTYGTWNGSSVSDGYGKFYSINRMYVFSQGFVQLGVRYTF